MQLLKHFIKFSTFNSNVGPTNFSKIFFSNTKGFAKGNKESFGTLFKIIFHHGIFKRSLVLILGWAKLKGKLIIFIIHCIFIVFFS
jgi:hypothetical protein